MNLRTCLTATALAVLLVAGCSSSSSSAPTLNRTDPRAVSDGFAKAWGAGDYATACGLTAGREKAELMSKSQCTGQAGWTPQTPRPSRSCTLANGGLQVFYQVDQQVDRFFLFTTGVNKQPDGTWAVESLSENDPGEYLPPCPTPQPTGTA